MDADKEGRNTGSENNPEHRGRNNNTTATGNVVVVGGHVDTSRFERAMWLMKCPPVVSRSLQPLPPHHPPPSMGFGGDFIDDKAAVAPSRPVAKVIISIDPLHSTEESSEFTLELASTESGNVPKRYAMEKSKDFVSEDPEEKKKQIPVFVFCESSQGKISVEGRIICKFDLRPHSENIESYGKLCRERTNKYMKKGRQIQVIDHENRNLMRPMPMPWLQEKKKTPAKAPEMKRTRKGRGEMEEIMFKLFERQSNWTLRQLINETDQPEQFMKDILKDLCVYNNKGTNQGTYELKPEYRKSTDDN